MDIGPVRESASYICLVILRKHKESNVLFRCLLFSLVAELPLGSRDHYSITSCTVSDFWEVEVLCSDLAGKAASIIFSFQCFPDGISYQLVL